MWRPMDGAAFGRIFAQISDPAQDPLADPDAAGNRVEVRPHRRAHRFRSRARPAHRPVQPGQRGHRGDLRDHVAVRPRPAVHSPRTRRETCTCRISRRTTNLLVDDPSRLRQPVRVAAPDLVRPLHHPGGVPLLPAHHGGGWAADPQWCGLPEAEGPRPALEPGVRSDRPCGGATRPHQVQFSDVQLTHYQVDLHSGDSVELNEDEDGPLEDELLGGYVDISPFFGQLRYQANVEALPTVYDDESAVQFESFGPTPYSADDWEFVVDLAPGLPSTIFETGSSNCPVRRRPRRGWRLGAADVGGHPVLRPVRARRHLQRGRPLHRPVAVVPTPIPGRRRRSAVRSSAPGRSRPACRPAGRDRSRARPAHVVPSRCRAGRRRTARGRRGTT